MNTVITVLIALVVPVAWGLASAWLFDVWRARRRIKSGKCGDGA
jgi:hypothetical protein